jgi:hypothetical protein
VNVQIVAFPQSGVMRCPGVLDLLDAAVCEGADLVGGIDPLEIDRDPKGQLITASGVPEAIAAHPSRKLVLFDGRIVARDSAIFPAPAPIA